MVHADDPCSAFQPKNDNSSDHEVQNRALIAKMHKAISIIQFKLDGQAAMRHPEYQMENRLLLDKIDREQGTVKISGNDYPLLDKNFPTLDMKDPYTLTQQEQEVVDGCLCSSFLGSEKLQRHIDFLYKKGSMYRYYNRTLMFHGCIPLEADGSCTEVEIYGKRVKAKSLFDACEELVRQARFSKNISLKQNAPGCLSGWQCETGYKIEKNCRKRGSFFLNITSIQIIQP